MYIVLTAGSYTGRIGFQATYASFPSGAQQPIMEPAATTIAPAPNVPPGGKCKIWRKKFTTPKFQVRISWCIETCNCSALF